MSSVSGRFYFLARDAVVTLRRRPFAAFALCVSVGFAIWLILSPIHRLQDSDTLIPALISLRKWTFFYWSQNRYGMLQPLLAVPLKSPFHNLLFQNFLSCFSGVLAYFFAGRFFCKGTRSALITGTISLLSFMGAYSEKYQFFYFVAQPYGQSLFWVLMGLIVQRRLLSVFCLALAAWINISVMVPIGGIFFFRYVLARRREDLPAIVRIATVFIVFSFIAKTYPEAYRDTSFALVPLKEWHVSLPAFFNNFTSEIFGGTHWIALFLVLSSGIVVRYFRHRDSNRELLLRWCYQVGAVMLAAMGFISLVAVTKWVKLNDYSARYAAPAVFLIWVSAVAYWVESVEGAFEGVKGSIWATVGSLSIAVALCAKYGLPSVQSARSSLSGALGPGVGDEATHIAGDYWRVWPAVFQAEMTRHERGIEIPVWGIAFRALPTQEMWSKVPEAHWRVATPRGDLHVKDSLDRFGLGCLIPLEGVSSSQAWILSRLGGHSPRRADGLCD